MPVYFQNTTRGKGSSILAMSGTRHDLIRFADALKREVSESSSLRNANQTIEISRPRLLSDDFTEITIRVVDEEKLEQLQRAGARKRNFAVAIWLMITGVVISLYFLSRKP